MSKPLMTNRSRVHIVLTAICCLLAASRAAAQKHYFPPAGQTWERRTPAQVGMDPALVRKAVEYAQANETDFPRDFATQETIFGRRLGPLPKERGGTSGIILRYGYIVAEFGDTSRPDPTYSAAKSYLSTLLGIAIDRGLVRSADDPVGRYVKDGGYDSPHNSLVTWLQHAQQSSEWQGEMWGKDHAFAGEREFGQGSRQPRDKRAPGQHYEYNDVRINRFALSLLRVFKRPLPDVLKSEVMDPIGGSGDWKWVPYDNAYVDIEGKRMPSVSGGTRWGGGLWISARDHARFGLLFLNRGNWDGRQVVSERWVKTATTPSATNPDYGCLWWVNSRGSQWPGAPKSSYAAVGFGGNTVWVDPEHDIVVVWRWHKGNGAELFRRVVESVRLSAVLCP